MKKIIIPLFVLALTACQSTTPNKVLSESLGTQIKSIYQNYNSGNKLKAINAAKELKAQTPYDKAYINYMLGLMFSNTQEPLKGVPYLKKALLSKELNDPNHQRANVALSTIVTNAYYESKALNNSKSLVSAKPIVRIDPRYPIEAARNGIEGHVIMSFDILPNGSVDNIFIVQSSPQGVFDNEARKALKRWKYLPKKIDGQVTGFKDQTVRLDFTLD